MQTSAVGGSGKLKKFVPILKKTGQVPDSQQPNPVKPAVVSTKEMPPVHLSHQRGSVQGFETFSKAPRAALPKNPGSKRMISLRNVFMPVSKSGTKTEQEQPHQIVQIVADDPQSKKPYRSAKMIPFSLTESPALQGEKREIKQYKPADALGDRWRKAGDYLAGSHQNLLSMPSKKFMKVGSAGAFQQTVLKVKHAGDQTSKSPTHRQYHDEMTHRHKWSVLLQPPGFRAVKATQGPIAPTRIRKARPKSSSFIRASTITNQGRDCRVFVNPDGQFKMVWESVKLVMLLYTFIFVPFSAAFMNMQPPWLSFGNKLLDIYFLVDMVLVFLTPVYSNHELVFDSRTISKHYFSCWFWLDLLAFLPLEEAIDYFYQPEHGFEMIGSPDHRIRLLRLTKLLRLVKGFNFTDPDNMVMRIINYVFRQSVVGQILPNILIMVTFLHLFACTWYIVGNLEPTGTESWISINGFQIKDELESYLISFFLMVTSFTSCGYGDIISHTNSEMVIKLVVIISGSLLYGIFLGRVTDYRSELMVSQEKREMKLNKLEEVVKTFGMANKLKLAVTEAIQAIDTQSLCTSHRPKLDFSSLSREEYEDFEVLRLLHKYEKIPLVAASDLPLHKKWVLELGKQLEKKEYKADDVIYSKGDPATYLYILAQGSVTFMMDGIELVPILRLTKGFFGEREILLQSKRSHTVVAESSTVIIYKLARSDFKRIFLAGSSNSNTISPWPNNQFPANHRKSVCSMRSLRSLNIMQGPKSRMILQQPKATKQNNSSKVQIAYAPKVSAKLNAVKFASPKQKDTSNMIVPSIKGSSESEGESQDPLQNSHKKFVKDLWKISNKRQAQLNQMQLDFDFFLRRKMFWKLVLQNKKKKPKQTTSLILGTGSKDSQLARGNSLSTRN